MKRAWILMLLLVAGVLAGCGPNKGAAQTAITAAQAAYDAAKDQAMMIVPQQALGIQAVIADARANMDKGEFKAAIDSANVVPARVKEMMGGLAAKTAEMQAEWEKMKEFPQALVALNEQVVKLAKAKQLPQGIEAAKVEAAKAALGTITQNWTEAQAAYQGGNLAEAMSKAAMAKQAAVEAMNSLSMAIPEMMKE
jgi:predicted small secreted protein